MNYWLFIPAVNVCYLQGTKNLLVKMRKNKKMRKNGLQHLFIINGNIYTVLHRKGADLVLRWSLLLVIGSGIVISSM